jgi:hypothetical protein
LKKKAIVFLANTKAEQLLGDEQKTIALSSNKGIEKYTKWK